MNIDINAWGAARDAELCLDARQLVEEALAQNPPWATWVTLQLYAHQGSHLCSVTLENRQREVITLKAADTLSWRRAIHQICRQLVAMGRRWDKPRKAS